MVSKQKMLKTRVTPSDLSCLRQFSLIRSAESTFNLQTDMVGLLSPLAQLSIKKETEKKETMQ